jgi:hypothetical protein
MNICPNDFAAFIWMGSMILGAAAIVVFVLLTEKL